MSDAEPSDVRRFDIPRQRADQALIEQVLAEGGHDNFVPGWLKARGVAWATDLIPHLAELEASK